MGELLLQFRLCNPAQGRRSSGGQDPGAKVTKEGLVLLTSKAERSSEHLIDSMSLILQFARIH